MPTYVHDDGTIEITVAGSDRDIELAAQMGVFSVIQTHQLSLDVDGVDTSDRMFVQVPMPLAFQSARALGMRIVAEAIGGATVGAQAVSLVWQSGDPAEAVSGYVVRNPEPSAPIAFGSGDPLESSDGTAVALVGGNLDNCVGTASAPLYVQYRNTTGVAAVGTVRVDVVVEVDQ